MFHPFVCIERDIAYHITIMFHIYRVNVDDMCMERSCEQFNEYN